MTTLPAWPKEGYPSRATAEAWARESKALYRGRLESQYIHLSQQFLYPHHCPNCLTPMAVVDATHIEGDDFICSQCEAKLRYVVPLVQVGPVSWEWALAPHQISKPDSQEAEK